MRSTSPSCWVDVQLWSHGMYLNCTLVMARGNCRVCTCTTCNAMCVCVCVCLFVPLGCFAMSAGTSSPTVRLSRCASGEILMGIYLSDVLPCLPSLRQNRVKHVPYIYTAWREAFDTGLSLIRPMYYDFPESSMACVCVWGGGGAQVVPSSFSSSHFVLFNFFLYPPRMWLGYGLDIVASCGV